MSRFRLPCILALSGIVSATGISSSGAEPNDLSKDPWPGLVQDIFSNRPMSDGRDGLEDAAHEKKTCQRAAKLCAKWRLRAYDPMLRATT